jgi:CHAT domain-containing protein
VLASSNEDGRALYQMLIAPVSDLIRPGSNVVLLNDDALSQLNFETLIVPTPRPHYWIEDATVVSAPSLYMLASAKSSDTAARKALLLGDALSPDPDYPELPKASAEMRQIEKHFAPTDQTVFVRQNANPTAYLTSSPQQYAYIHFVAHGVASLTDPLDSAIILSRANVADDSFKLYARDIIQWPLHARLVTISSCYGGGTRAYAGEGLVGLSWAFLRAGAHNVIGALWEVSDDSTPALMDVLYQGLEQGMPPSAALRRAKLALLHGPSNFRHPFFWAPFQIYTGI